MSLRSIAPTLGLSSQKRSVTGHQFSTTSSSSGRFDLPHRTLCTAHTPRNVHRCHSAIRHAPVTSAPSPSAAHELALTKVLQGLNEEQQHAVVCEAPAVSLTWLTNHSFAVSKLHAAKGGPLAQSYLPVGQNFDEDAQTIS